MIFSRNTKENPIFESVTRWRSSKDLAAEGLIKLKDETAA